MIKLIQGMKFSSLFLLACGSVVKKPKALEDLGKVTKECGHLILFPTCSNLSSRLGFSDTFAFGADRLICHPVVIWMMLYADRVIISQQPSDKAVPNLLYSSDIGKHTSVIHLRKTEQGLTTSKFVWSSNHYRPNTFSVPLACPVCCCIAPWRGVGRPNKEGSAYTLKCKNKEGGSYCVGSYEVPAAPSSDPVKHPHDGTWLQL